MRNSFIKSIYKFNEVVILAFLISFTFSCNYAQKTDLNPGKERWEIKTSIADDAQRKTIALKDLLKLPDPIDKYSHKHYDENRITDSVEYKGKYYKEGDIITTYGYIHVVALEKDENKRDGDYHIQILPSKDWADSCLIIEVPFPDFVLNNNALQDSVAIARKFIDQIVLKGIDTNTRGKAIIPAVYVKITGQLFFDGVHLKGGNLRGKSVGNVKNKMHSYTCWEVHPVMSLKIVPEVN
jgi:hypothetical protein